MLTIQALQCLDDFANRHRFAVIGSEVGEDARA
jgi:hypothetical protein